MRKKISSADTSLTIRMIGPTTESLVLGLRPNPQELLLKPQTLFLKPQVILNPQIQLNLQTGKSLSYISPIKIKPQVGQKTKGEKINRTTTNIDEASVIVVSPVVLYL